MNGAVVVLALVLLFVQCSSSLEPDLNPNPNPNPDVKAISNITVIGTVFCDACCDSTFSKHSYFISGAQVRINCNFRVNSASHAEISITADKTTDQYGVYTLDIPPIDGLECKVSREIDSFCRASLTGSSPSSLCNIPAVTASAEHVSVREPQTDACVHNLNALYYRPEKNVTICSGKTDTKHIPFNTSLFFWPPLFHWPWRHSPSFPFPFPFPSPPSFPIPMPFFTPPPPFWQFPLPPIPFFTPPPPPPFWHLPPLPFFTQPPPPPPPSFPFPFPFPPWGKAPTPPPSPTPSFPYPLPPLPPIFIPSSPPPPPPPPSPPPPSFSFPIPHFPPITSWFAPPPPPPPPPSPPPSPPTFHFPFPPIQFPPFPPLSPTPDTPAPPPVSSGLALHLDYTRKIVK